MKEIRLHEGELNVMELLWSNKALAARDISKIIKEYIGWEKNTTYTVIKRLIDKGAITREDPGFICWRTSFSHILQIRSLASQNATNFKSFYPGRADSSICLF